MTMNTQLLDCGHPESAHSAITRGYGMDADGKKWCYDCCAAHDRAQMDRDGKTTLYLSKDADDHFILTNWPGSLTIHPWRARARKHNMAGSRYDVWFNFNGRTWHGVQYGENTQLCHCKRLKK